ncbi:hypothetical protein TGCAST_224870C, partial [Toxoplasma gondii CAST]
FPRLHKLFDPTKPPSCRSTLTAVPLFSERLASPSPPEDTGETSRGTGEDEAGRRTASEALVGMPCTGREGDVCGAWRANRVRKGAPYFSIRRLVAYDSDNVGFVALNSLACVGRPLLFLATLMLLPLSSALEAMEADKALPWHLEEQTLRSTLEAFPELFAAYYPDEAQPGEGSLTSPLGRKGLSSLEPHGETRSVFCAGLRTQKEESESLHIQEGRPLPTRLPLPLFEVVLRQQHRQRMEGARCHHRGERTCKALGGPACLQDIEGESEPATCARAEDERINREAKEALHSPEKSYGPRDFFVCPHGSNHEEEDLDSLLPDCIVSLDADCVADSSPRTWRGDVSLLAMLSDVTGLDASALLRPLPLFRRLFELQRARMRRQRLSALLSSRRLASGASAETDPEEKSRDHVKEVKEDAEGERVLLAWLRSGEAFSAIKGDALGVSRGSQEAEKESQGSLVTSTPALSNRHPASATCTAEGLSVAYYIAQGRPAMAFHLLFALRAASSLPFSSSFSEAGPTVQDALAGWTKQAADRVCLNLSEAEQEALYDVALTVALYNMLNDGVVAAALCFLELCGLETERVRVDALSARQIYLHRKGLHAHTSTAPNAPFSRRSTKKKGAEVEAGDAGEVTVTAADSLSADGGRARETGDTPRGGASAQATGLEGSGFEGDETEDEAEEDAWFPEMAEEDIVPDEEAASVIDLFLSFPKPTKRPTTTTGAQTGEDDDGFGSQDEGGQEEQGARKPRQRDDKKADTKLCKDENEEEESSAGISSPHLLAALRMLEEATWSLDPNLATTQAAAATPLSLDSPWHLVGLFCRVHQLPRSLTLLHELARNDEWLLFLHEGDLQQCPVQTMTNIIDGYFRDAPLRHHLRIVVRSVERPPLSLSPPASRVLPFSCSFDEADADGEDAVSFPDLLESESPSKPFLVPESWTVDSSPLSLVERQAAPTVEERPQPETGLSPLEERNGDPRRGDGSGKEQADPTEASGLTSAHLVPRTEPRNDTGPPCPGSGIRLPNADVSDVMSLLLKSRVASPALGLGSPQDVPGLAEARAQQPLASVSPLSSPSPPLSTDLQGVGTQLLLHALKVCCPRLSVYAACFADASSLVCVNTWLYLQTQTLLLSSRFPGDRERRARPSSAGGDAAPGRYASYELGGARRSRRKRGEEGDGRRRRRTLERAQLGELELGARIEHDPNREHPEASLLELTLLGLSAVTSWRGESGRGRKRSREREEDLSSDADAAEETEGTTRSCGPGRRRRDADGGRKAKKRGEEVVCGDLFLGDSGEGDKEGARESAGRLTPPAFFPSSTEGEEEALLLWLSDPRHTVRLVLWLCEEGMYSLVIRAFRLFDESNVLLDILLFFRAFLQCRFEASERLLRRFVERRDAVLAAHENDGTYACLPWSDGPSRASEETEETPATLDEAAGAGAAGTQGSEASLGLVPDGLRMADALIHFLLGKHPLFRRQLLQQLHSASYCPSLSLLFHSYILVEQHKLPSPLDFRSDSSDLLDALIALHKYQEARRWRRLAGLTPSFDIVITVHEVTHLLASFKQGGCWADGHERLKTWIRSFEVFRLHRLPKVLAALFFLDVNAKLERELFARDQAMLLAMALQLLLESAPSSLPSSSLASSPAPRFVSRHALLTHLSRCVDYAQDSDDSEESETLCAEGDAVAVDGRLAPAASPVASFFPPSLASLSPRQVSSSGVSDQATLLSCVPLHPVELLAVFKSYSRSRRDAAPLWRPCETRNRGGDALAFHGGDKARRRERLVKRELGCALRAHAGQNSKRRDTEAAPGKRNLRTPHLHCLVLAREEAEDRQASVSARGEERRPERDPRRAAGGEEEEQGEEEPHWGAVVSETLLQDVASRLLLLLAGQSISAAEEAMTPPASRPGGRLNPLKGRDEEVTLRVLEKKEEEESNQDGKGPTSSLDGGCGLNDARPEHSDMLQLTSPDARVVTGTASLSSEPPSSRFPRSSSVHHPLVFESYSSLRNRIESLLPPQLPALPFSLEASSYDSSAGLSSAFAGTPSDHPREEESSLWDASCSALLRGASSDRDSRPSPRAPSLSGSDQAAAGVRETVPGSCSRGPPASEARCLLKCLQSATANLINCNHLEAAKSLVLRFSPAVLSWAEVEARRASRACGGGDQGTPGGESRGAEAEGRGRQGHGGEAANRRRSRREKGLATDARSLSRSRRRQRDEPRGGDLAARIETAAESKLERTRDASLPGEARREDAKRQDARAGESRDGSQDIKAQLQLLADDVALVELLLQTVKVFSQCASNQNAGSSPEGPQTPSDTEKDGDDGRNRDEERSSDEERSDRRAAVETGDSVGRDVEGDQDEGTERQEGEGSGDEVLKALKRAVRRAPCFSQRDKQPPPLLPHQVELLELLMDEDGAARERARAAREEESDDFHVRTRSAPKSLNEQSLEEHHAGPTSSSPQSPSSPRAPRSSTSFAEGLSDREQCILLVEQLVRRCTRAILPFSNRLLVCLAISHVLDSPFSVVVQLCNDAPHDLLLSLLQRVGVPTAARPRLVLCRHYLNICLQKLPPQTVARVLVRAFVDHQIEQFRSASVFYSQRLHEEGEDAEKESEEEEGEEEVVLEWFEWPLSLLYQFVCLGGVSTAVGEEALGVLRLQTKLWDDQEQEAEGQSDSVSRGEKKEETEGEDRRWWASALPLAEPLPLECEVEVMILAYSAFASSSSFAGVADLLAAINSRLDIYVATGRFYLLQRLLVTIPAFQGLERALE